MLPFLIPILWSAGLGAALEGIVSAVTASGDTAKAKEDAIMRLTEAGFDPEEAAMLSEGVEAEAGLGDRALAGLGGAARGALVGALGTGASMGAYKLGGMALNKLGMGGKLKSFLGGGDKVAAEAPMKPMVPDRPSMRKIRPPKQGEPTSVDEFADEASALQSRKGPGVLVGEATGGFQKLPEPRTVEAVVDRPVRGIGMRDDATLNRSADDVIEASMSPRPRGIGYNDPMAGASSFLMQGTKPFAPRPRPHGAVEGGVRAAQMEQMFEQKAALDAALRAQGIENEYARRQLMERVFGG